MCLNNSTKLDEDVEEDEFEDIDLTEIPTEDLLAEIRRRIYK